MEPLVSKESVAAYLHQVAAAKGEREEAILEKALQLYWRDYEQEKLQAEENFWRGLSVAERAQYEGQSVAIHDGNIVDHDKDDAALYRRIRAQYGGTPVMMTEGGELGLRDLVMHGVRFE